MRKLDMMNLDEQYDLEYSGILTVPPLTRETISGKFDSSELDPIGKWNMVPSS